MQVHLVRCKIAVQNLTKMVWWWYKVTKGMQSKCALLVWLR
jgi:hypothetical protein